MTHKCSSECTADWKPSRKCHCATCGHNFTVVTNFDKHRKDGACLHPADAGLVYGEKHDVWRGPGEPDRFEGAR